MLDASKKLNPVPKKVADAIHAYIGAAKVHAPFEIPIERLRPEVLVCYDYFDRGEITSPLLPVVLVSRNKLTLGLVNLSPFRLTRPAEVAFNDVLEVSSVNCANDGCRVEFHNLTLRGRIGWLPARTNPPMMDCIPLSSELIPIERVREGLVEIDVPYRRSRRETTVPAVIVFDKGMVFDR